VNFECQRCGACCRIKDGIVRVSDAEIARIATFLGTTAERFVAEECEVAPDRKSLMPKRDGQLVEMGRESPHKFLELLVRFERNCGIINGVGLVFRWL